MCVCVVGKEGQYIRYSPPIQAKGAKIFYTRHPPPTAMKCHNNNPEQFFVTNFFKHQASQHIYLCVLLYLWQERYLTYTPCTMEVGRGVTEGPSGILIGVFWGPLKRV
jgi:hypothetical protein